MSNFNAYFVKETRALKPIQKWNCGEIVEYFSKL